MQRVNPFGGLSLPQTKGRVFRQRLREEEQWVRDEGGWWLFCHLELLFWGMLEVGGGWTGWHKGGDGGSASCPPQAADPSAPQTPRSARMESGPRAPRSRQTGHTTLESALHNHLPPLPGQCHLPAPMKYISTVTTHTQECLVFLSAFHFPTRTHTPRRSLAGCSRVESKLMLHCVFANVTPSVWLVAVRLREARLFKGHYEPCQQAAQSQHTRGQERMNEWSRMSGFITQGWPGGFGDERDSMNDKQSGPCQSSYPLSSALVLPG